MVSGLAGAACDVTADGLGADEPAVVAEPVELELLELHAASTPARARAEPVATTTDLTENLMTTSLPT
jgi:hypothetical protein